MVVAAAGTTTCMKGLLECDPQPSNAALFNLTLNPVVEDGLQRAEPDTDILHALSLHTHIDRFSRLSLTERAYYVYSTPTVRLLIKSVAVAQNRA